MAKWKCEICDSEFDNFQAQGLDHKIYCPLCYFKELNNRKDKEIKRLKTAKKKAIEYIEKEDNIWINVHTETIEGLDELLQILQGEYNENK